LSQTVARRRPDRLEALRLPRRCPSKAATGLSYRGDRVSFGLRRDNIVTLPRRAAWYRARPSRRRYPNLMRAATFRARAPKLRLIKTIASPARRADCLWSVGPALNNCGPRSHILADQSGIVPVRGQFPTEEMPPTHASIPIRHGGVFASRAFSARRPLRQPPNCAAGRPLCRAGLGTCCTHMSFIQCVPSDCLGVGRGPVRSLYPLKQGEVVRRAAELTKASNR